MSRKVGVGKSSIPGIYLLTSQTRRSLFDIATCIREVFLSTVGTEPCFPGLYFFTMLRYAALRHIAHRLTQYNQCSA